jgi:hypothetical protein
MDSGESDTKKIDQRTIHCNRHGDNREALMCKHLLHGSRQGFLFDAEELDNPFPDAWCSECERVRTEKGESGVFSDEYACANFKLVCGECYQEIKARNEVGTNGSALGR